MKSALLFIALFVILNITFSCNSKVEESSNQKNSDTLELKSKKEKKESNDTIKDSKDTSKIKEKKLKFPEVY